MIMSRDARTHLKKARGIWDAFGDILILVLHDLTFPRRRGRRRRRRRRKMRRRRNGRLRLRRVQRHREVETAEERQTSVG